MSSSKKGNVWHFGMKTHVGVDANSGLVHTAGVTTGCVHDAKVLDALVREEDLVREKDLAVFGDKGTFSDRLKRLARAAGVLWAVKDKRKRVFRTCRM